MFARISFSYFNVFLVPQKCILLFRLRNLYFLEVLHAKKTKTVYCIQYIVDFF